MQGLWHGKKGKKRGLGGKLANEAEKVKKTQQSKEKIVLKPNAKRWA
jgi:hypothetical protein